MRILRDFQGLGVRLAEERLAHILEHPEMTDSEAAIEETLLSLEQVLESLFDPEAGCIIGSIGCRRSGISTRV